MRVKDITDFVKNRELKDAITGEMQHRNLDEAKTLELLDPYVLRANGLDRALPLTHLGRALFHLNQRRGFRSNRKTDRGDNESGKIKDATKRLDEEMARVKARTYGEFLHMRRSAAPDPKQVPGVRTRLSVARRDHAEKEEPGYDFYPDRQHLSDEFEELWRAQASYHPDVLTDNLRDEIGTIIFHQRPLKSPEVGLCLFTDEHRIPSSHPLDQRRILLETINNLKVAARGEPARGLTSEERDQIVHALDNKAHTKSLVGMTMKLMALGKVIKLRGDQFFTLETASRDAIARDLKLSEDQKREVQRDIKKNTEAAIMRGTKLEEMGVPNNGANRMVLRLWESLGHDVMTRNCPYTGQRISAGTLFSGSCDVDHILPFSRTLDDSFANRTLCLKEATRQKTNKTPWEVWGDTPQWDVIASNLKNLPANKAWRFASDAMERFEGENDFSARALKDTQYLSRIARSYLDALYDGQDGKSHVWVVPGRLTEMLRRHWGLNGVTALTDTDNQTVKAKNRTDHRHHAIDAAVVAATDRSLIKRISEMAKRDEHHGAEQVVRSVPPPWEGFRSDISARLHRMIVSHRADHGRADPIARKSGRDSTSGQLHNDTAYGLASDNKVVSRKPLLSLKPNDIAITTRGANIHDADLQKHLARVAQGLDGKAFEQALVEFANAPMLPDKTDNPYFKLRRVRLEETLQESARIEVKDKTGKPFKAYKSDSNQYYEIWRLPDGKIRAQVVTTFEAHQSSIETKPHPAAKRLLRVFKRDMIKLEKKDETVIGYVQSMHVANGLFIAPHTEANADARNRDKNDPFKFIQIGAGPLIKANARRIHVDEMGRLRDPGPPK